MKQIEELDIPENLAEILEEEGYWEDETFEPIILTVEEVSYKGKDMLSYQAAFDVFDAFSKKGIKIRLNKENSRTFVPI